MNAFTGTEYTFDSREAIERIDELTAEFVDSTDSDPADIMSIDDWRHGLTEDDAAELVALIALRDECDGYVSDWTYGETFIHEGYFTAYCMEMLSELEYLPTDMPSWIIIDGDATADNMKEDYTAFEFMGSTYYALS